MMFCWKTSLIKPTVKLLLAVVLRTIVVPSSKQQPESINDNDSALNVRNLIKTSGKSYQPNQRCLIELLCINAVELIFITHDSFT